MREIKFRGKRKDNGEWIYGYYVFRPDGRHLIYWQPFPEATQNTYHEVIPETVGQYTGLHDKNGKELYEGDIYEETRRNMISGNIYKCKIISDYKTFQIYKGDILSDLIEWEIIGNIYENPELLK